MVHHGEGRWNGVAILTRLGGDGRDHKLLRRPASSTECGRRSVYGLAEEDFDPLDEARMVERRVRRDPVHLDLRTERPRVDSPFYVGKLAGTSGSGVGLRGPARRAARVGGDFNVAPTDADVWECRGRHGGTHVSPPSARRSGAARRGLVDGYRLRADRPARYTWWDYRAASSTRTSVCASTTCC